MANKFTAHIQKVIIMLSFLHGSFTYLETEIIEKKELSKLRNCFAQTLRNVTHKLNIKFSQLARVKSENKNAPLNFQL